MRTIAAAAVAFALLCTASASAQTLPIRTEAVAEKATASVSTTRASSAQLQRAARQVGTIRKLAWACQDALDVDRTRASTDVWSMPRSVGYRIWVAKKWVRIAKTCQATLRDRTIPLTNDWVTAVRIVQRVYPGTADWMLSISDREGGWGPWVWYGGSTWSGYHVGDDFLGADTVGGWMQFRFSTFDPYWRHAQEDLARRGYIIPALPNHGGPAKYQAWLSPLAQALTAGYMRYTGRDGCHWCL